MVICTIRQKLHVVPINYCERDGGRQYCITFFINLPVERIIIDNSAFVAYNSISNIIQT